MDVKYQVFVSSTFIDLQDERRAAIEAILNIGHIPVGMEAFQASDDTQWDYIKRRIDESDYYVVIVGERYGSEDKGKSYTQMEYEYAVASGVPVAGFLLDPTSRQSWPSNKVEFDKRDKVENFRNLCQQKLVKFWRNTDELGGRVSVALNELMRQKPRTGWVRADVVPSANVLEELTRLSEEKRLLQAQVEALSEVDQKLSIPADVRWLITEYRKTNTADYFNPPNPLAIDMTLLDFFMKAVAHFAAEIYIYSCRYEFQDVLLGANNTDDAASDVIDRIMLEFLVGNLIEKHTRVSYSHNQPSSSEVYRLTDFGKKFAMLLKEFLVREAMSDQQDEYKDPEQNQLPSLPEQKKSKAPEKKI